MRGRRRAYLPLIIKYKCVSPQHSVIGEVLSCGYVSFYYRHCPGFIIAVNIGSDVHKLSESYAVRADT